MAIGEGGFGDDLLNHFSGHCSRMEVAPQYAELEKLHQKYKKSGLQVLGFPCNDYGAQEPGSNEEIIHFCTKNYGVTFDLFDFAPKVVGF